MAIQLNSAGKSHAMSLVRDGKVDKASPWSFSSEDGNKMLGPDGNDWAEYSRWHLAEDTDTNEKTKDRYKYPFGKDGKVYRRGVIAAKSRAAAQGEAEIEKAASDVLDAIDKKEDKKYWIINRQDEAAEILLYEEIGAGFLSEGIGAKKFATDLKAMGKVKDINLRINSPGGSVFEGLAIYNTLKAHPAVKTVYIDGIAASIASVIAMAGDSIVMPENSMMMIHDPLSMVIGTSEDMKKEAEALDKIKAGLVSAYRNKSGMSDAAISGMMSEETWLTADECVAFGLADSLSSPVQMTAHFDLSKFRNVPNCMREMNYTDKEVKIMTVEDVKIKHRDIYDVIFNAGRQRGMDDADCPDESLAEAEKKGKDKESARIKTVFEALSHNGRLLAGYEAAITEMLFDGVTYAEQAALKILNVAKISENGAARSALVSDALQIPVVGAGLPDAAVDQMKAQIVALMVEGANGKTKEGGK